MVGRSLSLLAVSSLLAASAAFAQANGNAPGPRRQIPPPTNLQVLPKDTTGPQVIAIMRTFEGDLGVECTYCHAKDPATGHPNFASDANPMKNRARVMMRMTKAINAEYLTQLTDPKSDATVTCGTCHRGMSTPPEFVPPPREHEHHEAPATPPPAM
ncbi:MAG TPA: c-type cytochrome [Candidatus Aquilonibacter sp.]|nr:c-type cytochrome [Candidatus Aquilonibacter sp.]